MITMHAQIEKLLTISTKGSISKLQYPSITKEILLNYFYAEIKFQNHTILKKREYSVYFTVTPLSSTLFRPNRFLNCSEGEIIIEETAEYLFITFIGKLKNGLLHALIVPSILLIPCIFLCFQKFNLVILLIPIFMALFFIGFMLLIEKIGKQFYFSNNIYRIKEDLRDKIPII